MEQQCCSPVFPGGCLPTVTYCVTWTAPSPLLTACLTGECRAGGQENKGGRVRELESQLEEVRSHYHHRLRSLENQLQVLLTPPLSPVVVPALLSMTSL